MAHATTPDDASGQDLHDRLFGVPVADPVTGSIPAQRTDADSQPADLDADPLLGDHEVGGVFPTSGGVMGAVAEDARVWARRGVRPQATGARRIGLRGTAALVGVGALLVASPAAGYWLASTSTTGTVTSETLSAPSSLTATATATTLTIAVSAPNGGPTPTGYTITPSGSSTAQPCTQTGGTSGPVATCVVAGLASSTSYNLAVRSTLGSWVSSTSTSLTTSTAAAPAPAVPTLAPASDSGTAGDGITNATTPTVTGAAADGLGGAAITLLDGSVAVATATAAADGSWTATVTSPLAEGSHLLTAVAALNGGARGTASAVRSVRVDTTAPAAPTVASATCGIGAGTSDANGWYCRNGTFSSSPGLRLTFDATDAVGVSAFRYAVTTSTTSMPSVTPPPSPGTTIGTGVATARLLSAAGYARVGVVAVDLAGNVSTPSSVPATVDTTAPTVGTGTATCRGTTTNGWCRGAVDVALSGISDTGVTSLATAADWSVAGGTSGTATLTTSGSTAGGSFSVSVPDGQPVISWTTRDAAGNVSSPGAQTSSPKVDNTAPTATAVTLSDANGVVGKGDQIALTFADATSGIDPKSVWSGWSSGSTATDSTNNRFTVTITDTGTNDTLTVTAATGSLSLGSIRLGANYVTGTALTFSGSGGNATTLAWSNGSVTVTLGQLQTGSTNGVATNAPLTWTPPTTVTDLARNALPTTSVTGSGRF